MTHEEAKAHTLEDAIRIVLSRAQEPMKAAEIWREIDKCELATATWADPAFQVACHINALINQEADGGEESPYEKVSRGVFRIKRRSTRKSKARRAGRKGKATLRTRIIDALKEEGDAMNWKVIAEKIGAPIFSVNATLSSIVREGDKSPIFKPQKGYYSLRENIQKNETDDSEAEKTGLVRAFGMFWDAQKVQWSSTTPKILGRLPNDEQVVDFHDQKGVYVLYDGHRPVYVGQSSKKKGVIGKRLRKHATDKKQGRWNKFSWFGFCPVDEDDDGKLVLGDAVEDIRGGVESLTNLLEGVLIEVVEPSLNRRQGDGLEGIEYLQVADNDDKQPELEELEKLIKKLRYRNK